MGEKNSLRPGDAGQQVLSAAPTAPVELSARAGLIWTACGFSVEFVNRVSNRHRVT